MNPARYRIHDGHLVFHERAIMENTVPPSMAIASGDITTRWQNRF